MSGLKVVFTVSILLSNLFAQESDNRKPTRETIQSQIDSLKEVRVSFERKMERIDSLLKILEIKKAENEAEQFIIEGIILTTKKVFGTDLPKLRPSPDIDAAEIKVIPPGTKIRGFAYRDDGYWRVYYDGTVGFLLDSYIVSNQATEKFIEAARLRRDKRQKELIAELKKKQRKIESAKVWVKVLTANIREEPSRTAVIPHRLERGEPLYVQLSNRGWLKVMFGNPLKISQRYQSHADFDSSYDSGWIHQSLVSKEKTTRVTMGQRRRQEFVDRHQSISQRFKNAILNAKIILGMNREMVSASWGEPGDINKSVGSYGVHEQWIYGDYTTERYFLYFENGVLTSWQE